jgi:ketosteroid isomerase-like protein
MRQVIITSLASLILGASIFGQKKDDAKDAVAVVNKLFDAMAAADAAAIMETGTAENQLVAIQKMRDGKTRISVLGSEAFSKFFTKPGSVKEVMYAPKVETNGDWAMVWGRYVFYAEGKLSHCGINQFNLVRTDAGWKIANGASTIDPGDCTKSEKAMKPK